MILPAESCENLQENRWSFVLSMHVCMVVEVFIRNDYGVYQTVD